MLELRSLPKVANELFNALHEDELQLINELYLACEKEDLAEADRLMDLLLYDVEEHFSTEEELMKEADFFAYPMHKAEHDTMRGDLKALYSNWKTSKDTPMVMDFIKDKLIPWLLLHISRWDSVTAMHIGS